MTIDAIKQAASLMGRKGGSQKSVKKTLAARKNAMTRWDRVRAMREQTAKGPDDEIAPTSRIEVTI